MSDLWLVRHGESTGNVAAARALAEGSPRLAIDLRDADVPLTALGEEQAAAVGRWLAELSDPPSAIWCSPYLRARETARIAADTAGIRTPLRIDERLRDRELGILDLYSSVGVQTTFPEEASRRRRLGKFWYRPPGGESWADVVLRLRSVLPEMLSSAEGPLLVVAHDVVVSLFVYVCCGMSDTQILELARQRAVGNASVTTLATSSTGWELVSFAAADHLREAEVPVTKHSEESHADVL